MDTLNIILSIVTGICAAIPLAIQLVKYIQKAMKERNWTKLLSLVMQTMEDVEKIYTTGEERKQQVMNYVKSMSKIIDYDITDDDLSSLVDALCDFSNVVNSK